MKKNNKNKRAALTLEISLGLVAALVILLIVLGTFNDNLAYMVKKSNFQGFFHNTSGNTAVYKGWDKDPTTNIVATASSIGDELVACNAEALRKIKEYAAMTPPLTLAQQRDLAKQFTLYGVSNTTSDNPGDFIDTAVDGVDLYKLRTSNHIKVNFNSFYTNVGENTTSQIQWGEGLGSIIEATQTPNKQSAITSINNTVW